MKKYVLAAAACLPLALSVSAPVDAQGSANSKVLADRLGQCMVSKTTGEDRVAVASWMLAAMASAPQLKDVAVVAPARKDQADRKMASIFTRLMTKDCAVDAKALFAARDPQAFQLAGRPLGEVAMQELISNPKTLEALGAYTRYLNPMDFAGVAGGV